MSSAISGSTAAFYATLPSGYAAAAPSGSTSGSAAAPADIVDIRVPLPAAAFTVRAGDSLSVRDLFGSPTADLMRVGLRGEGGGRLMLRGEDVTDRTDFDPLDFNELQFVAGADASLQEIVAVARKGTKDESGTWTKIADSAPVQITARVTGTRSVEALPALRTAAAAGDSDAAFISVAQDAAIFAPLGSRVAPTLSSAGDITLKAGDSVALHDLFTSSGKTEAALYRVALRGADGGAPGTLLLDGADVSDRTDFTPEEFINLQFVAGPDGSAQDLLVVARAGTKREDGSWTGIVDSPAAVITASITGARSANAARALRTEVDPAGGDANYIRLAQEAQIFAPIGGRTAPAISSEAGEVSVKAGDSLSFRDLFPTSGKTEAALYRVALRDDPGGPSGGRLMLDGEDVTSRRDFSPIEFLSLQYVAGPEGGAQDILVVARAGTPDGSGGLTGIADSAPALLRAEVTGRRSLDIAEALRTPVDPAGADADFMRVAAEAAISVPLSGRVAPDLVTAGNFTAAEGDSFALRDLFASPSNTKVAVSGYRVALRDEEVASGARLMLDGVDVSRQVDFTPEQFNSLQFLAGATGSSQDLLVVARSTDDKGLFTDSRAVQITASSTGERSINALPALRGGAPDDSYARIAQDASVYAPLSGKTAASLSAVGDFTAKAGDMFSMNTLFGGKGSVFEDGMSFRVGVRRDAGGSGDGKLLLNGVDVTGRSEFTGIEFASLVFQAGPDGSAQDVMVVARNTSASGAITDSPAVEITARSTGARSINGLAALRTDDLGETGFDRVIRDAAIYEASSAPRLASPLLPANPSLSADGLAAAVGAYRATGSTAVAAKSVDLTALFGGVVEAGQAAGAASAKLQQLSELVTLLGGGTVGGVRTTGTDISKLTALALNARA